MDLEKMRGFIESALILLGEDSSIVYRDRSKSKRNADKTREKLWEAMEMVTTEQAKQG